MAPSPDASRRVVRGLVAAGLAATLASLSCSGGPTGVLLGKDCAPKGPYLGQFEGSATGAVSDTLAGCAYFALDLRAKRGPNEDPEFGLLLSNGEVGNYRHVVRLLRWRARPPAGTYMIGNQPQLGHFYGTVRDQSTGISYEFTGGTLVLEQSEAGGVVGTLSLTATQVGGAGTVSLSGAFHARCVDPGAPGANDEGHFDQSYMGPCHTQWQTRGGG